MKTCREFADDLIALADDECSSAQRTRVQAHLEACAGCHEELVRLQQSLSLASLTWAERASVAQGESIPVQTSNVSQTVQTHASAEVTIAERKRSHRTNSTQFATWAAAAIAVALLLSGALWWWSNASNVELANAPRVDTAEDSNSAENLSDPDQQERVDIEAEIAQLTREIEDVAQIARLTAAAEFLRERPELEAEYQSAMEYITRRGSE